MLPNKRELQKITDAKRKLNEKQKALRDKLYVGHDKRVILKGKLAQYRKNSVVEKAKLRKLIAIVGVMLSDDRSDLDDLIAEIERASVVLMDTLTAFDVAREKLSKLQ
jgi:hypothetical protein